MMPIARNSMMPRRIEVTIGEFTFDAVFTPPNKVVIRDPLLIERLGEQLSDESHIRRIMHEEIGKVLKAAKERANRD